MKRSTAFSLILTLGFHLLIASPPVLSQKPNTEGPDVKQSILVKVYYFHTSYRCANCKKFEKWSKETVDEYFKDETEKGLVAYEKMNIEEKENKHVVEDYRLVTKSIILSKIVDGEENTWKNGLERLRRRWMPQTSFDSRRLPVSGLPQVFLR